MEVDRQRQRRKTVHEILDTVQVVAVPHLPVPQAIAHQQPHRQTHLHQLRPQVED